MWTDGRYYLQIEKELFPGWQMKKWERNAETVTDFVIKSIPIGSRLGVDFKTLSNGNF